MGNNTPITEEQFKMLVSLYPESFLEPPLADHDLLRFRILFGIIMFCAVVFNILVIAVILRNKSMRTVTNTFLLSLAVSDLLIAAVCMPFQLYELAYQEWSLGEGLCRFYAYFQGVLIVSSILTLLIVAVDRYYAICHPLKARHVHTVNRALIITAVIWALSFTLMTPQLIVQKIDYKFDNKLPIRANVPYCREYFEHHWEILLYTSFTTFGFFLIPLIGIYVSYGRVAWRLWIRKPVGDMSTMRADVHIKQKKRVIKMLILLVAFFTVCWTPFFINHWILSFVTPGSHSDARVLVAYLSMMGYLNSCVNPIVYAFMNDNFKEYFVKTFCVCLQKKTHNPCTPKDGKKLQGVTATSNSAV